MLIELPWIAMGRHYIGLKEIPGPQHNQQILLWLHGLKAWWTDDETPWCGVFVAAVLQACGLAYPKLWMRASEYMTHGVALDRPAYGAVVVLKNGNQYHVGFIVGVDNLGNLMVLGGNQGNKVSIAPFKRSQVQAIRWPNKAPAAGRYQLPLLTSDGKPVTTR